jgi:hypothetical protein
VDLVTTQAARFLRKNAGRQPPMRASIRGLRGNRDFPEEKRTRVDEPDAHRAKHPMRLSALHLMGNRHANRYPVDMDPFNTRGERLAIRTFCVGVAIVLALMSSLRLRAEEIPAKSELVVNR